MSVQEVTISGECPTGITLADLWVFIQDCNTAGIDPRTTVEVDTFWTSKGIKRIEATG